MGFQPLDEGVATQGRRSGSCIDILKNLGYIPASLAGFN